MAKYYGVIAPGIKTVTQSYDFVRRIKALYPYPKFRKFYNQKDAWEFVNKYKYDSRSISIQQYGDLWDCYVDMMYAIDGDEVKYTITRHNMNALHFSTPPSRLCNTSKVTTFVLDIPKLNDAKISSHLVAIEAGLKSLGDLLSVNVIVPDYSVYYAVANYSGNSQFILNKQKSIKNRMGCLAYTVRR